MHAFKTVARLFCATAALAIATVAFAQSGESTAPRHPGARMQQRFAAADKNGDGRLSREEAQTGMPFVAKHFDEIDRQKTGFVTLADIAGFARERRAAKRARTEAPPS